MAFLLSPHGGGEEITHHQHRKARQGIYGVNDPFDAFQASATPRLKKSSSNRFQFFGGRSTGAAIVKGEGGWHSMMENGDDSFIPKTKKQPTERF